MRLIDLADERGAVGINLLDANVFTDRDRTADAVVRVARGLWEQWGPRMQSILEQTVKTLHEANSHPATRPEEQYTILDGLKLLTDESFRLRGADQAARPLPAPVVGERLRQVAARVPVRRPRSGANSAQLLRLLDQHARAILGQPQFDRSTSGGRSRRAASCWSRPPRARSAATWPPWSAPRCSTWSTR